MHDYPTSWALVPIPVGKKGPTARKWNERNRCRLSPNWNGNVGLAHAYSQTCAIDIDNLALARRWLALKNVDLDALLEAPDAVKVSSGRPNRAKLLYRLEAPVRSKKIIIDEQSVIDFRCADSGGLTMQDVLPPSLHPDTGKPYEWQLGVAADWRELPEIPPELLAVWQAQLEPAPRPENAEPHAPVDINLIEARLADHDPDCDRDQWVKTLAAIHYETHGSEDGLNLADAWSAKGTKYKGRKDVLTRWRSFKLDHANPVTIASLRVDKPADPSEFEELPEVVNSGESQKSRFRVIPAPEFSVGRPLNWIIKGVIPRAELIVIYGESGSGKTFVTLDLVAAISTGRAWRDLATKRGRVVYICAEGVHGFRQRLKAYSHQFSVPMADLPGVIPEAPNFLDKADPLAIAKEILTAGGADVIVVDTLSAVTPGGNENAGEDMGRVLAHCKGLNRATGAVVILIHHSGKDAARGARGWSGLRAAADAEFEVTASGEERVLAVTKQKDSRDDAQWGFKLVPVPIGIDEDGEAVESCVIEPAEVSEKRSEKGPRGTVPKIVFNVAQDLLSQQLDGNPVDAGDIIRAAAAKLSHSGEGRDRRIEYATRGLDTLVGGGFLQIENGRVSLCH